MVYKCIYCGEKKKIANTDTEALGHDWGEWDANNEHICSRCGAKEHKSTVSFDETTGVLTLLKGNVVKSDVRDYSTNPKLKKIVAEEGAVLPENCWNIFSGTVESGYDHVAFAENLTSIDLSKADTSNVTNMNGMFLHLNSLEEVNLSGFDTSNVTDMFCMFEECSSMTSLDVSGFDTSKVKGMERMFCGCTGLESLDLSSFDTSKVEPASWMFAGCEKLKTIYVSDKCKTASVGFSLEMFDGCTALVGGAGTVYDITKTGFKLSWNEVKAPYALNNTHFWVNIPDYGDLPMSEIYAYYMELSKTGITEEEGMAKLIEKYGEKAGEVWTALLDESNQCIPQANADPADPTWAEFSDLEADKLYTLGFTVVIKSDGKPMYMEFIQVNTKPETVEYKLSVNNEYITSDNCEDILGTGTLSFEPATNTLYIKGDMTLTYPIISYIDDLKVVATKDSTFTADSDTALYFDKKTSISGTGKLTIIGKVIAITGCSELDITDAVIDIKDSYYGIFTYGDSLTVKDSVITGSGQGEALLRGKGEDGNTAKLTIINSDIEFNYSNTWYIRGFGGGITLTDCYIAYPDEVNLEADCLTANSPDKVVIKAGSAHVHEWGDPVYEWAADLGKVTAKVVCALNSEHAITETVNTVKEELPELGKIVYHAVFTDAHFTEQTKEVPMKTTTSTSTTATTTATTATETTTTSSEATTTTTTASEGTTTTTTVSEGTTTSATTTEETTTTSEGTTETTTSGTGTTETTTSGTGTTETTTSGTGTTATTTSGTGTTETTTSGTGTTETTTSGTGTGTTASTSQTTAASSTGEQGTTTTETKPVEPDKNLGDMNGDGKVDAKDASLILVAYSKASTGADDGLTDEQRAAGDVNGDGKVDAKDASMVLAYYALVSTSTGDVPTLPEFARPKQS